MRRISVPLSTSGIESLERSLEEYLRWQREKAQELAERLAELGVEVAELRFSTAAYDGTKDVSVSKSATGNGYVVKAEGQTVLFIEFGTGVTYPDNHPEAAQFGMRRGEYGKGRGKQSSWGYYGDDPGTNGVLKVNGRGEPVVITHGNPAAMPMYEARKTIEQELPRIVREVFG